MNLKLAIRSVLRNRWRSGLTAGGIAAAVAMLVWSTHLSAAMLDYMVVSITGAEIGDVRITAKSYIEEKNLLNAIDLSEADPATIAKTDGVMGASARVQAFGLVGNDKLSQIARIIGVDPTHEASVSHVPGKVKGEWLPAEALPRGAPRPVVMGKILAKQLKAELGTQFAVSLQNAYGEPDGDKIVVIGIVATGATALDRMGMFMHISDAQLICALEGKAHEIAIKTDRGADLAAVASAIKPQVPDTLAVQTWQEVVPSLHSIIELSKSSMWFLYIIIYFVAALGILNTQRMTALERRREFGVLLAIGTTPVRLGRQVVGEAVVLTALGGLFGALLGGAASFYHQVKGLDFGLMQGGPEGADFQYLGISFNVFHFHLDPWLILQPAIIITFVGLLCGLWPAISSARLDAPRAIAGRT